MRGKKAVLVTLILLAIVIQLPLAIGAPDWLTGWDYRKSHTITGSVAGIQTDYPMMLGLDYGAGVDSGSVVYLDGKCRADFGDIRFTTSDGRTLLDYWIEDKTDSDSAIIWVEVGLIPESPDNATIYLYYGNAGAYSLSDGDDTFTFYDHFLGDAINGSKWGGDTGSTTVGSSIMTITGDGGWKNVWSLVAVSPPYAFRMKSQMVGRDTGKGCLIRFSPSGATPGTYSDILYLTTDNIVRVYDPPNYEARNSNIDTNENIYEILWDPDEVNFMKNEVEMDGSPFLDSDYICDADSRAYYGSIGGAGYEVKTDWAILRKYVNPEPISIDWGEEEVHIMWVPTYLFGAGFNASTPRVDLYWTTNLTGITLFEVQNSTDKVSWDHLGSNTTTEYHDFQVMNGTERYYRVRVCNFTGGAWDNSTWSDINFETVYFISEVIEDYCKIRIFNASSITVIAGTLNDGNLASTYFVDGDWYNVSEINDTPGLDVRFNITNIDGDPNCGCLDVYHSYKGHPQHDIKIQVWNFTSTSWRQIGTLIYNETAGWECSGLGNYAEHFFHNGSFWGRFYHEIQGHVAHEMQIDQIRLDVIYGEEVPPCEEAPALLAMSKYYALAIILLILGLLIGIGMRRRR